MAGSAAPIKCTPCSLWQPGWKRNTCGMCSESPCQHCIAQVCTPVNVSARLCMHVSCVYTCVTNAYIACSNDHTIYAPKQACFGYADMGERWIEFCICINLGIHTADTRERVRAAPEGTCRARFAWRSRPDDGTEWPGRFRTVHKKKQCMCSCIPHMCDRYIYITWTNWSHSVSIRICASVYILCIHIYI